MSATSLPGADDPVLVNAVVSVMWVVCDTGVIHGAAKTVVDVVLVLLNCGAVEVRCTLDTETAVVLGDSDLDL